MAPYILLVMTRMTTPRIISTKHEQGALRDGLDTLY